jgi:hypothetical protein
VGSLGRRRKETFVLFDVRAFLQTESDFLGTAHSVVQVLGVVHECYKLINAVANELLVEQDEHLVAKSRAASNEAEGLVEHCDTCAGTGLC